MLDKKTFCERIKIIKAADKQLKDAIEHYFEKNNPFIETQEAIAFPAAWIYGLTENHLKTLFLAVNEKIGTAKVIENWDEACKEYEAKMEEFRKSGIDTVFANISKPNKDDCERTILDAEVDYYYYENEFGGEVTKDSRTYELKDSKQLYEYIKLL